LAVLPVLVGIAIKCHRSSDRQLSATFPHSLDPNQPAGLLQSGRTASHRFSCFASPKRPLVISRTRPWTVGC